MTGTAEDLESAQLAIGDGMQQLARWAIGLPDGQASAARRAIGRIASDMVAFGETMAAHGVTLPDWMTGMASDPTPPPPPHKGGAEAVPSRRLDAPEAGDNHDDFTQTERLLLQHLIEANGRPVTPSELRALLPDHISDSYKAVLCSNFYGHVEDSSYGPRFKRSRAGGWHYWLEPPTENHASTADAPISPSQAAGRVATAGAFTPSMMPQRLPPQPASSVSQLEQAQPDEPGKITLTKWGLVVDRSEGNPSLLLDGMLIKCQPSSVETLHIITQYHDGISFKDLMQACKEYDPKGGSQALVNTLQVLEQLFITIGKRSMWVDTMQNRDGRPARVIRVEGTVVDEPVDTETKTESTPPDFLAERSVGPHHPSSQLVAPLEAAPQVDTERRQRLAALRAGQQLIRKLSDMYRALPPPVSVKQAAPVNELKSSRRTPPLPPNMDYEPIVDALPNFFEPPEGRLAWQAAAICAQTDPEAFFPEKGGSPREAKIICAGCVVNDTCLVYAVNNDERFGIWGGLSERERRRLGHAIRNKEPIDTINAYVSKIRIAAVNKQSAGSSNLELPDTVIAQLENFDIQPVTEETIEVA